MSETGDDEPVDVVRAYLDGVADGEYRADLVTDEFVAHVPSTMDGAGHTFEERAAVYDLYHEAFPDFDLAVEETVATDETVVVQLRLTGTHEGRAFAVDGRLDRRVEPTGERVDVHAAAVFQVADGAVTQVRWFADKLQLLTQLGVFPE